jgi:hypothetical protein
VMLIDNVARGLGRIDEGLASDTGTKASVGD